MITKAKISAGGSIRDAALIWGPRLLTFLSQMRRLFEGGAYSSKYSNIKKEINTMQTP